MVSDGFFLRGAFTKSTKDSKHLTALAPNACVRLSQNPTVKTGTCHAFTMLSQLLSLFIIGKKSKRKVSVSLSKIAKNLKMEMIVNLHNIYFEREFCLIKK